MPTKDSDLTVKKDYNDCYDYALRDMSSFYEEAEVRFLASLGDQWTGRQKQHLTERGREHMVFNYMHRVIQLVSGYQRQHRLAFKISPSKLQDGPAADILSQAIMHDMERAAIYEVMSDAFEIGSLRVGMNLVMLYMNYAKDPVNGRIEAIRVPHASFVMDPNIFKRDLSDCRYLIHRMIISKEAAVSMLPNRRRDINNLKPHSDHKFLRMPIVKVPNDDAVRVDLFWRQEYTNKKILIDTQTGQEQDASDWTKAAIKDYFQIQAEAGKEMALIERSVPEVNLNILIEDVVMHKGPEPWGIGDYPYVPVMGFWFPEITDWKYKLMPLGAHMIDPQREVNKRRSQMVDVIEKNLNSGWLYEQRAIDDPSLLYRAGQGFNIPLNDGAISENAIQQIPPAQIPPSWLQVDEMFTKAILEIPGANNEMLGLVEHDNIEISGILAKLRQAAGLTTLQPLIDGYRFAKSRLGYKMVKMIQANYGPQKIMAITGAQQLPENLYRVQLTENDIIVTEGVLSDTQRQEYFMQLLMLKQMGVPIPEMTLLKNAPIANKQELIQEVQQGVQQQQQLMEQQRQMENLTAQMMQAKTASDIAASRMKLAAEEENRMDAAYKRAKIVGELSQLSQQDQRKAWSDFMDIQLKAKQLMASQEQPRRTPQGV